MESSFRSLLACALPGAVVLLASWWYAYHRKRQLSYQDKDVVNSMGNFQTGGVEAATSGQLEKAPAAQEPYVFMQESVEVLKRSVAEDLCLEAHSYTLGSVPAGLDSGSSVWTQPCSSPPVFPPSPRAPDLVEWEVVVPKHLVGRLIGQKGRAVSFLKRRSGAKIYVFKPSLNQDVDICHIEGSRVQVDCALKLIGEKFADLDLTNQSTAPDPTLNQKRLPPITWVVLPEDGTVDVVVVKVLSAIHLFVHQHRHPSHHALHSLDEQMYLCYSQRGVPHLHSHIRVGTLCAAPGVNGSWWRAQVSTLCDNPTQVEVRYVDYGGYEKVKVDRLRQLRSDFVALPFQGTEVVLEHLAPLPGMSDFSTEAASFLEEMTRGVTLIAQVTRYNSSGRPMVQLWKTVRNKLVSVSKTLVAEGFCSWLDAV